MKNRKRKRFPYIPCAKGNDPSPTARGFFTAATGLFVELYSRWQDEKDFEPIKEYKAAVVRFAKDFGLGIAITRMTAKPFGCEFTSIEGRTYRLTVNKKTYKYARIR